MPAKILAIDDQEDNLALLQAALEANDFAFYAASSGPAGLALTAQIQPDLILLDLAMPGMDGFEVLEQLRASPATRLLPVIILTANYRESGQMERGFELGATEYLTKPVKMDELLVRLRTALRLARAERELERLRRDFASMLVHDMRAPLDGVRLALGALQRQEPADSPRRELFALALGSLADVGSLVEDLLEVNRLDDEGFTARLEPVDVAALAEASVQALQTIAQARGLGLRVERTDAAAIALADPRLARRTLDNLVANALKFTDEGEVVVRVSVLGGAAELSVRDTGPGIAPDVLPHVFDRYFHLERRRTNRQGGLGLGLAFCRRATEAMGGSLAVASEEGRGSEFRVTLPLAADVSERRAAHPA